VIPNAQTLPESQWVARYGPTILRKGKILAVTASVQNLQWSREDQQISAIVRDKFQPPAEVEIGLTATQDGWSIDFIDCDCGRIRGCAHSAAVLATVVRGDLVELSKVNSSETLPNDLRHWLLEIHREAQALPSPAPHPAAEPSDRILYLLQPDNSARGVFEKIALKVVRCRRLKTGANGKPTDFNLARIVDGSTAEHVLPVDVEIARRLSLIAPHRQSLFYGLTEIQGPHAIETLRSLIASGRCHWASHEHPPLRIGSPRTATPHWQRNAAGHLQTSFELVPPARNILAFDPPWFIDTETAECGPLQTPFPSTLARVWLKAPVLDPIEAASHVAAIAEQFKAIALPPPPAVPVHRPAPTPPVPSLHLATVKIPWWEAPWSFRNSGGEDRPVLSAQLSFVYGEHHVPESEHGQQIRHFDGQTLTLIPRDRAAEGKASDRLLALGLVRATKVYRMASNPKLGESWTLVNCNDEGVVTLVSELLPTLRAEGWQITRDPSFALEVCQPSEWYFETEPENQEPGEDWFGLELGVRVGDEKINLLPVLLEGLRRNLESFQPDSLKKRAAKESVLVQLADGRRIPFPAGRLRDILATLLELHSPGALADDGRLRVHRLRAAQLGELADAPNWTWSGAETLKGLAERLQSLDQLPAPTLPPEFGATLRPYQTEGLRWLQFIREFQIGGVLADDMGLGKTIQTLAHLLVEKSAGRLDRPALVVSPTSVLVNWRDEIARFAPTLRVLTLHGSTRHSRFGELQAADVVLTTYALLARDAEFLLKGEFHCVILDEAQNIKNPKTQAAQTVCQLKARHRLCLSGTPIENHLGELWSLFNFLIPGFLSDETRFRAVFRQPIEKDNDTHRRKALSRRVRPFLLRRRKDEVARDLPEKTEIVRKVELPGSQRDLYETIRLAMENRVRDEVKKKGVSRSHIVILDALLKLRQVCCDPRLVPLEAARNVTESAKLDLLMELLPTLLEDGRRILLFSQFTSMLALIEQRLAESKIPWLLLTGETTDRATPVRRFQAGEVPLFLLSLKAGGSGLNLTAADTVILFDPWWNPAVEAQATDRAHRIGQDKPVFVYRLIAAGTVEEKMAELQTRKRQLVQALLEDGTSGPLQLQKEDIDLLFAPIG